MYADQRNNRIVCVSVFVVFFGQSENQMPHENLHVSFSMEYPRGSNCVEPSRECYGPMHGKAKLHS